VFPIIKAKLDFPWGTKMLGRVLKNMGFTWRKCKSKCTALIKRADTVEWRSKYLVKMK
jgi:hypothetical protein